MKNQEGSTIPHLVLRTREGGSWGELDTQVLFGGRTVIVFSLPGAFTPTCSSSHVPRYNELADSFASLGVDEIVCVSVNDPFVMEAWKKDEGADRITFLPDGNGAFTEAMGMLVDKADLNFGRRSWRYSMLVRDGRVEKMFPEPEIPGDPFQVSDADTMLAWMGGTAPPDILLLTKPGCAHCTRAKEALTKAGLQWAELPTSPRILRAVPGPRTTPVVFVDGSFVGGADELVGWLSAREH